MASLDDLITQLPKGPQRRNLEKLQQRAKWHTDPRTQAAAERQVAQIERDLAAQEKKQKQEAAKAERAAKDAKKAFEQEQKRVAAAYDAQNIGFYRDEHGVVRPITAPGGGGLTKADKHGLMWDPVTGKAFKMEAGAVREVDPAKDGQIQMKDGSVYSVVPGMAWKWLGYDAKNIKPDRALMSEIAATSKNLKEAASAAMGALNVVNKDIATDRARIAEIDDQLFTATPEARAALEAEKAQLSEGIAAKLEVQAQAELNAYRAQAERASYATTSQSLIQQDLAAKRAQAVDPVVLTNTGRLPDASTSPGRLGSVPATPRNATIFDPLGDFGDQVLGKLSQQNVAIAANKDEYGKQVAEAVSSPEYINQWTSGLIANSGILDKDFANRAPVPIALPAEMQKLTGLTHAPESWFTPEAMERQLAAKEAGQLPLKAPEGYVLEGGVLKAPQTEPAKVFGVELPWKTDAGMGRVGELKFDQYGVPYLVMDPGAMGISPSFETGNYYHGIPEYAAPSADWLAAQSAAQAAASSLPDLPGLSQKANDQLRADAIAEASIAWESRAWGADQTRDFLDQWTAANDAQRAAMIALVDPRQSALPPESRRLDPAYLHDQGYLSKQDARLMANVAYGAEPGMPSMDEAFNAWVKTSDDKEAVAMRSMLDTGSVPESTNPWLTLLNATSLVLTPLEGFRIEQGTIDAAKAKFASSYMAEVKRNVDFSRAAYSKTRDEFLASDAPWWEQAGAWMSNTIHSAVGSSAGLLTYQIPALLGIGGGLTDDQKEVIGLSTNQAIENFGKFLTDRISLNPLDPITPGDLWSGKKGGEITRQVDELLAAVDAGTLTTEQMQSRAAELNAALADYHSGEKASQRQPWENDILSPQNEMSRMLAGYIQTGDPAYAQAFRAAAFSSSWERQTMQRVTDYATLYGQITPNSYGSVLFSSYLGAGVAPLTETGIELATSLVSLGASKVLMTGAKWATRAERAGDTLNFAQRAFKSIEDIGNASEDWFRALGTVKAPVSEIDKLWNAGITLTKNNAVGAFGEGFEEVIAAMGESGATLGDAFVAGLTGTVGGFTMSGANMIPAAVVTPVQKVMAEKAQAKALQGFVDVHNRMYPENQITLDLAKQAQQYQSPEVTAMLQKQLSDLSMQKFGLQNQISKVPQVVPNGKGGGVLNPAVEPLMAQLKQVDARIAATMFDVSGVSQNSIIAAQEINGLPESERMLVHAAVKAAVGAPLLPTERTALLSTTAKDGQKVAYLSGETVILSDSFRQQAVDNIPFTAARFFKRTEADQVASAQPAPTQQATPGVLAPARQNAANSSQVQDGQGGKSPGSYPGVTGSTPVPATTSQTTPPPLPGVSEAPVAGTAQATTPPENAQQQGQVGTVSGAGTYAFDVTYIPRGSTQLVTATRTFDAVTAQEAAAKREAIIRAIGHIGAVQSAGELTGGASATAGAQQVGGPVVGPEQENSGTPQNKAFVPAPNTATWELVRNILGTAAAAFGYKIVDTGIPSGSVNAWGTPVNIGTAWYDKMNPGSEIGQWIDKISNSPFADEIAGKMASPGLHRVWFGHDFATNLGTVVDQFGWLGVPEYVGQLLKDSLTKSGIPFPGVELLVRSGMVSDRVATDWLSTNIGEVFGGGIAFFGTYRLLRASKTGSLTKPRVIFATIGVGIKLVAGVATAQPFLILSGLADAAILVTNIAQIREAFGKATEVAKQKLAEKPAKLRIQPPPGPPQANAQQTSVRQTSQSAQLDQPIHTTPPPIPETTETKNEGAKPFSNAETSPTKATKPANQKKSRPKKQPQKPTKVEVGSAHTAAAGADPSGGDGVKAQPKGRKGRKEVAAQPTAQSSPTGQPVSDVVVPESLRGSVTGASIIQALADVAPWIFSKRSPFQLAPRVFVSPDRLVVSTKKQAGWKAGGIVMVVYDGKILIDQAELVREINLVPEADRRAYLETVIDHELEHLAQQAALSVDELAALWDDAPEAAKQRVVESYHAPEVAAADGDWRAVAAKLNAAQVAQEFLRMYREALRTGATTEQILMREVVDAYARINAPFAARLAKVLGDIARWMREELTGLLTGEARTRFDSAIARIEAKRSEIEAIITNAKAPTSAEPVGQAEQNAREPAGETAGEPGARSETSAFADIDDAELRAALEAFDAVLPPAAVRAASAEIAPPAAARVTDPAFISAAAQLADALWARGHNTPVAFAKFLVDRFANRITPKILSQVWNLGSNTDPDAAVNWTATHAAVTAPAKAPATNDPDFVEFSEASGTLGIPRDDMPQIKLADRDAFTADLRKRGIEVTEEDLASSDGLKPTQKEYSPAKAEHAKGLLTTDRRVFVSNDNYIIDGHHQYVAAAGGPLKIVRIDLPVKAALRAAAEFPKAKGGTRFKEMKPADVLAFEYLTEAQNDQVKAHHDHVAELVERFRDAWEPWYRGYNEAAADFLQKIEQAANALGAVKDKTYRVRKTPKGIRRIIEKAFYDEGVGAGKASMVDALDNIKDVLAATFLVRTEADIAKVRSAIEAATGVPQSQWNVKDTITKGSPFGYRDIKLRIKIAPGIWSEIILITPEMYAAKEGNGHPWYELGRSLEALKEENGGKLPTGLKSVAETVTVESKAIYDAAWESDSPALYAAQRLASSNSKTANLYDQSTSVSSLNTIGAESGLPVSKSKNDPSGIQTTTDVSGNRPSLTDRSTAPLGISDSAIMPPQNTEAKPAGQEQVEKPAAPALRPQSETTEPAAPAETWRPLKIRDHIYLKGQQVRNAQTKESLGELLETTLLDVDGPADGLYIRVTGRSGAIRASGLEVLLPDPNAPRLNGDELSLPLEMSEREKRILRSRYKLARDIKADARALDLLTEMGRIRRVGFKKTLNEINRLIAKREREMKAESAPVPAKSPDRDRGPIVTIEKASEEVNAMLNDLVNWVETGGGKRNFELPKGMVASRYAGEARREVLEDVWSMYQKSYGAIGMQFTTPEELLADSPIFDVLYGSTGATAFNILKVTPYGLKTVASGTNGTDEGRAGYYYLQDKLSQHGYFAEQSGASLGVSMKMNLPKVSSADAKIILAGKNVTPIDEVTYSRPITVDGLTKDYAKRIFGRPVLWQTQSQTQTKASSTPSATSLPNPESLPSDGQNSTQSSPRLPSPTPQATSSTSTSRTTNAGPSVPQAKAAAEIRAKLRAGETLSWRDLFAITDAAWGGTQAQGVYTVKDAYDALELGINQHILHDGILVPVGKEDTASRAVRQNVSVLEGILARIPTQTKRTAEQDAMQQFSTPPHFAYMANWVAAITPADVVLESSAGIGGLAVFAKEAGATVIANELSPRRLEFLRQMGFDYLLNENAELMQAILAPKIASGEIPQPTVSVINPPFSNAAKSGKRGVTMIGAKHVEEALKAIADGGRVVAIVGEGMGINTPTFRKWWNTIAKKYHVRANVWVDGKNYTKYGTSFSNRLLVIDKVPPPSGWSWSQVVDDSVDEISQLHTLLEGIRHDRPIQTSAQSPSNPPAQQGGSTSSSGRASDSSTGIDGSSGGRGGLGGRAQSGSVEQTRPLGVAGNAGSGTAGRPSGEPAGGVEGNPAGTPTLGPEQGPAVTGQGEFIDGGSSADVNAISKTPDDPALMSPEQAQAAFEFVKQKGQRTLMLRFGNSIHTFKQQKNGKLTAPAEEIIRGVHKEIIAQRVQRLVSERADAAEGSVANTKNLARQSLTKPERYSVSALSVDAYGIELPEGYSRAGDFYVLQAAQDTTPAQNQSGITVTTAAEDESRQIENEDDIFAHYKPAKVRIPGAQKHLAPLVESAAMASVQPPDVTYTPNLPVEVITEGRISETSLENIVYAGQAHQQILSDGSRRGYLIGDGTGVGKGRQIAGIIMDNFRQGRTKAVWLSEKEGLMNDAKRDAQDIGLDPDSITFLGKTKKGARIEKGDGILFTTYSTLKGGHQQIMADRPEQIADWWKQVRAGKLRGDRLAQIAEWLGEDFDGAILFDEAHNAGNAIPLQGNRGVKKASATGIAVVDLQKVLPKARIVYVSATAATEVENLSYADRLGIWGEGTPFPNKHKFFNEIRAGGISAMEIVARDLKAQGLYLARSISYKGVEFSRLTQNLTPEQIDLYNTIAKAWQIVLAELDETMGGSGANNNANARSAAMSAFWGAQQRFFNQLLTAMELPAVLADMERELAAGHSLVLQIVNTNEATQNRQIAQKQSEAAGQKDAAALEDLDLSPRDILLQYLDKSFPTLLYEEVADPQNPENTIWLVARDSDGNAIQDPAAVEKKQALMDRIATLDVPGNPLEQIFEKFGEENIAEVTGRTQRVVSVKQPDGSRKTKIQRRNPSHRKVEADEFQKGDRRILIFSDAGGTGFSFHASNRVANRQRRIHYLVQAGWRADKALQGFGRTHRTDQASAPIYKLAETDIAGHKRFISTIARRLAQLGALTTGERKGKSGIFTETDNLESAYAVDAVMRLVYDLYEGRVEGYTFTDFSQGLGFNKTSRGDDGELTVQSVLLDPYTNALREEKIPTIPQFLNRILALPLAEQNQVFGLFMQRLEARITAAMNDGTYDPGTQSYRADAMIKLSDEVVFEQSGTGAKTRLLEIEEVNSVKFTTFSEIEEISAMVLKYVRNRKSGKVYVLKEGWKTTSETTGGIEETYRRIGTTQFDSVLASKVVTGGTMIPAKVGDEITLEDGTRFKLTRLPTKDRPYDLILGDLTTPNGQEIYHTSIEDKAWGNEKTLRALAKAGLYIPGVNDTASYVDPQGNYEELTVAEARVAWEKEIEAADKFRRKKVTFLVGAMLPIWDRIDLAYPKIYRFTTTDGDPILGVLIPAKEVPALRQRMGAKNSIDPASVYTTILEDGSAFTLANGWSIRRVMLSGDYRIELANMNYDQQALFTRTMGGVMERIQYKPRFFIPNAEVMTRVLEQSPVMAVNGKLIASVPPAATRTTRPPAAATRTAMDPEATELFNDNLPLASYFANKFLNVHAEFEDLQQEARVALWKAATTFEKGRGIPFGAYASTVIRRRMSELYRQKNNPNRPAMTSLDEGVGRDDAGRTVIETIADRIETLARPEDVAIIHEEVAKLPTRPREIWEGFLAGRTWGSIGSDYGLTKQRAQQIAAATGNTLRAALEKRGITSVDDIFPQKDDFNLERLPERRSTMEDEANLAFDDTPTVEENGRLITPTQAVEEQSTMPPAAARSSVDLSTPADTLNIPPTNEENLPTNLGRRDNSLQGEGRADDRSAEGGANGPQRTIDAYVAWLGGKTPAEARKLTDPERTFIAFATETGRVLPASTVKDLQFSSKDMGGEEHFVYRRGGRIWKVLQPGKGYSKGGDPLEYLMRIGRMQTAAPQLDIRMVGILPKSNAPRIVTSMAEIVGQHPTKAALHGWLQAHGWNETGQHTWEHTSGVEMADAAPDNFIEVDGDMVPIDVWFSGDVAQPMFLPEAEGQGPGAGAEGVLPPAAAHTSHVKHADAEMARIAQEASMARQYREDHRKAAVENNGIGAQEFWATHVSGRLDKLEFFAPGAKAVLLDNRREEALVAATINAMMDTMRQDIEKAFGYPKFWQKNRRRQQAFLDEILPTAARLEVSHLDDDGNFVFRDFDMRAGFVSSRKVRGMGWKVGDIFVDDGQMFSLGVEVPGRGYLRLRHMSAEAQQQIWEAFHDKYPESAHYLDRWIMPGMEEARFMGPQGTMTAEFNRHSLRALFNDWPQELRDLFGPMPLPDLPYVEGYTPDVAYQKSVVAMIASLLRRFKSGARKLKAGEARESGNIKNLFDGFSIRAMEAHREKIRVQTRQRLIDAAAVAEAKIPLAERGKYVPLDDAFTKLIEAVELAKRLDPTAYPAITGALTPQDQAMMARILGDAYRLKGRGLMIHKEVARELMLGVAREVSSNALTKIFAGLLERFNAGLLATPFTTITNWASNEVIKTLRVANRFNYAVVSMLVGDARGAKLGAYEFGFLLRGFITDRFPQWQRQRIGSIVPREIFDDQTQMEAFDVDPKLSVWEQLQRLNAGGAFLKAIEYGEIDIRQKQQMAYAAYRAHAEVAWSEAKRAGRIPAGTNKQQWQREWMVNAPAEIHRDVYLTTVLYLMDYQNVPAWLDPAQSNSAISQVFKRAIVPFAKWPYNAARQLKRFSLRSAFDLLMPGRTKQQRAEGAANLLTMAGLMALGAWLVGSDDDEDKLLGRNVDEEGKLLEAAFRTGNRINVSRLARIIFAHGLMRGATFSMAGEGGQEYDLWWRYRNYPYLKEAILMGLAAQGKWGEFGTAFGDISGEYISLGFLAKVLGLSAFDKDKPVPFRTTEAIYDVTTAGVVPTPWRQLATKLADPVMRKSTPSKSLGYGATPLDAIKLNTPGLSRSVPSVGQRKQVAFAPFSAEDWFKTEATKISKDPTISRAEKAAATSAVRQQALKMSLPALQQRDIFRDAGLPVELMNMRSTSSVPAAQDIATLQAMGVGPESYAVIQNAAGQTRLSYPDPKSIRVTNPNLELGRFFGGVNLMAVPRTPITKEELFRANN